MRIRRAERLAVPASAGKNAVALRIASAWGTYLIFSEFLRGTEVACVRFQGAFGVVCTTRRSKRWLFTCVPPSAVRGIFGFEDTTAVWRGRIRRQTKETLVVDPPSPPGRPVAQAGARGYVLVGNGKTRTGFPVWIAHGNRITVDRVPLQPAAIFAIPEVRYIEE